MVVSRRAILESGLRSAVGSLAVPAFNQGRFRLSAQSTATYSTVAVDLVRSSLVVDMLGLLTLDYRKLIGWQTEPSRFQPSSLKRLKDSGITVFHPAVGFLEGDVYQSSLADVTRWNKFLSVLKSVEESESPSASRRAGHSGLYESALLW